MSVRIIIDSTVDIDPNLKNRFTIVPLTVHFGDEEYLDGITINHKQFYEKLIESDILPTTSQAPPIAFAEVFEQVAAAGDTAVVITIASQLSGTFQSALVAAQDYEGTIFVVDSRTAAIGSGILAELALNLARGGASAAEIFDKLLVMRDRICLVALLDTLEYLKKGGRISKTAAFAGNLLSIKPVITIKDGVIHTLGKARGSKQGNNLLITEIQNAGGVDFDLPLLLGYTGLSDAMLNKYIEDSAGIWQGNVDELTTTAIGSVIGTHAGPGAVAVAFFKK
ncbi:MAG: DegV family protein [Firmicutes bacterium]|nr:DegV family protein [Bacillota bacterium]